MSAPRVIKPEFFLNEDLFNSEIHSGLPLRLAYAGLWTCCDREGRFRWQPKRLGRDVLPYDDVDFAEILDRLATEGYIVRYSGKDVHGNPGDFGVVPKFKLHQHINNKEPQSELPEPPEGVEMWEPGRRRTGPKPATAQLADLLNGDARPNSRKTVAEQFDEAEAGKAVNHVKFVEAGGGFFRVEEGKNAVLCDSKSDLSDAVVSIPTCQAGVEIGISANKAAQYSDTYNGLDIVAELKKCRQWSIENAANRKTPTGMGRFINSWMGRAQNGGGVRLSAGGGSSVVTGRFGQVIDSAEAKEEKARQILGLDKNINNKEDDDNFDGATVVEAVK